MLFVFRVPQLVLQFCECGNPVAENLGFRIGTFLVDRRIAEGFHGGLLTGGQAGRDFDVDSNDQIARSAIIQHGASLVAKAIAHALRRSGGDFEGSRPFGCRHGNGTAECRKIGGDGNIDDQIIAIALEEVMFFHMEDDMQIAIRAAAHAAKLEVPPEKNYFAGTCAAAAVLTPQHKRDGALVIDLGGGSTAFTAWSGGRLVQAGVVGVGGDHVTNDIRIAFSVSQAQAEQLKTTAAAALIRPEDAQQRIAVPDPMPGFKAATISRRALNTVVNARLQELFAVIRAKLDEENHLHGLNAGVFLTGGGSALPGIAELARAVFGCGVRIGTLVPEIEGLEADPHPAACAVFAGLLLLAQQEGRQTSSLFDSVKKVFGGIFRS